MPDHLSSFHDAETRFEATFEQAAVGIAHVGPNGSWLRVNRRLSEMLGYAHEELLGMTFQDITHPDDLEIDLEFVRKMLAAKIDRYSMEKRYFRKSGEVIWINLTVSLVWRKDGQPDFFVSVIEDISRRKEAEQEIERLKKALVNLQEAERQHLALELHDEIGQRLSAIKIALNVALKKCSHDAVVPLISHAESLASGLIATTKAMAHALRPFQLDDFGLKVAVAALVDDLNGKTELVIDLDECIGEQRFESEVELAAYRFIQEALSNVLRHSRAQLCRISLDSTQAFLMVQIQDDGVGFDPRDPRHSRGIGLISMRERVQNLEGKFEIATGPGYGVILVAHFPVRP